MRNQTNRFLAALLLAGSLPIAIQPVAAVSVAEAASGAHRDAKNITRNDWRHPVETLAFFGLEPGMTVVEVWPGGGGWYSEVLAPVLRGEGKLYAANYAGIPGNDYFARNAQAYRDKLAAQPDVYDEVTVTEFMPPDRLVPAPAGSVDLVVTFRNLHNWVQRDQAEMMFKAMFDALKPGGVLGMVAHRGTPEMVGKESAKSGYLAEAEARRIVESVGFRFVAASEVNANSKDTRDHPAGVWTLPPNFRLGDTDREKYAAIGESDRMTLKFVKPE